MTCYEVTFFKHVLSSDGHLFKALQAAISVRADNIEQAGRKAKSRFECLRRIPYWNLHADLVEVVATKSPSQTPARPLTSIKAPAPQRSIGKTWSSLGVPSCMRKSPPTGR
jgi:hypothetical protein